MHIEFVESSQPFRRHSRSQLAVVLLQHQHACSHLHTYCRDLSQICPADGAWGYTIIGLFLFNNH
jgi:hypothetical protein